jgi:hypothetical protein
MEEQTNPATGVTQGPPADPMDGIRAYLNRTEPADDEETQAQPKQAEPTAETTAQPDGQGQTDELTADDLPDENSPATAQPTTDAFEIVHNGTQHKLSREETIKYAQQGFDYTQKTQALAEQARQVQDRLARVAAIEQVQPQLLEAQGTVQALAAQLQRYQAVDWVALATNDPLEYPKVRAQFDQLQNAYQQAAHQYQQVRGQIDEQRAVVNQQTLERQKELLPQLVPAWKDPARFKKDAAELRSYLIERGAAPEEVDTLNSALGVAIAYESMQYRRLVQQKTEKVKQLRTAPPVTRPGAAPAPGSAKAERNQELRERVRKTGDIKDGAAYLASLL